MIKASILHPRLTLAGTTSREDRDSFIEDVREGLTDTPKRLSSRHLYDREGSILFEEICRQPEYYLTDAEREILRDRAAAIVEQLSPETIVVELGSGSSEKTQILIDAFLERHGQLHYVPIDISQDALEACAPDLLADRDDLEITAFAGEYEAGLRFVHDEFDGPMCVLWLGSSVGNFTREDAAGVLERVNDIMTDSDTLLMGIDLRKDRQTLEQAYDDDAGVTEKFNTNILVRLNDELGGSFDLDTFDYRAQYNEALGRVEMYQVSKIDQDVHIADLDLDVALEADEAIHTEYSHKYTPVEIDDLAQRVRFEVKQRWFDDQRRYTLNLLAPTSDRADD